MVVQTLECLPNYHGQQTRSGDGNWKSLRKHGARRGQKQWGHEQEVGECYSGTFVLCHFYCNAWVSRKWTECRTLLDAIHIPLKEGESRKPAR